MQLKLTVTKYINLHENQNSPVISRSPDSLSTTIWRAIHQFSPSGSHLLKEDYHSQEKVGILPDHQSPVLETTSTHLLPDTGTTGLRNSLNKTKWEGSSNDLPESLFSEIWTGTGSSYLPLYQEIPSLSGSDLNAEIRCLLETWLNNKHDFRRREKRYTFKVQNQKQHFLPPGPYCCSLRNAVSRCRRYQLQHTFIWGNIYKWCFTERLALLSKEHSHRIPHGQWNSTHLPIRNKIRLKAGKKKCLPFANSSSAEERRASPALLGSWGSDSPFMRHCFPQHSLQSSLQRWK